MIAITYLGSGSEGNAALLEFGEIRFLLDVGLSARRIRQFLKAREIDPASLAGIFISHDHGDHTKGLPNLLKAFPLPVFTTEQTRRALLHQGYSLPHVVPLRPGEELERDGVRLRPFRLPHDAVDPIGLRAEWQGRSITVASDFGHVTPALIEHVADTDILCLESNYEPGLLRTCTYPDWLKRRISGPRGHFPNGGVGSVLSRLSKALSHLVLVHLSQESNKPTLAWQALVPFLSLPHLRHSRITLATQDEATPRLALGSPGGGAGLPTVVRAAVQHCFEFDPKEREAACTSTS